MAAEAGTVPPAIPEERHWKRLAALVEQDDQGIALLREDGELLYGNSACQDCDGLTQDPAWTLLREVAFPHARSHGAWRGEGRLRHGNSGHLLHVEWSVTAFRDAPAPEPACFGVVWRDVTGRKRAEELLQVSNGELQEFSHLVSHDLQEPLRSIVSYTQLLGRRYHGRLDADADEFIGYVVDGARRLRSLVDGILTLSRFGRERPSPFEPVSLSGVMDVAQSELQESIEETGAAVLCDSLPTVLGNRLQLTLLFLNLLANAIKYRRPDEPCRVRIGCERRPEHWVITVADNGLGFAPEYADYVFGVFRRVHGDRYPGRGIGLALCRKIVEGHGGRIWVETEEGKGSDFYVMLPAKA